MKKLLSLPPNLVNCFHDITGYARKEWFCTSDPIGHKLGSGGGSAWLLQQAYREDADGRPFGDWLFSEQRLLLHAGGQSRRLPAYAPSGSARKEIDEMYVAKTESAITHVGSRPPPVMNAVALSPELLRK